MNSLTTPDYTTSSCPDYTNHVLSSYYKSFLGQRISQETCALSTQHHTKKSIPWLLCFIFNSLSNPFHIFIMTRIYSFDTISDVVSDPNNFYKFLSLLLILLLSILMLSIKSWWNGTVHSSSVATRLFLMVQEVYQYWVFWKLATPNNFFTTVLRRFETCLSVNTKLCGEVNSLEQVMFYDTLRGKLFAFFVADLNLISWKTDQKL